MSFMIYSEDDVDNTNAEIDRILDKDELTTGDISRVSELRNALDNYFENDDYDYDDDYDDYDHDNYEYYDDSPYDYPDFV